MVPGECCALWYTGFTVKSSDFGTSDRASGTTATYPSCPRPNPPASLDPLVKTAALVRALRWKNGENTCFGKVWPWSGMVFIMNFHEFPCYIYQPKADIQLKPLNDTVKAVWDGTRSLWIHRWMKSGWIFWEFEFVWASAIGEFLSFRQPDFTMATVATLVCRELYFCLSFLSICRVWLYRNHI